MAKGGQPSSAPAESMPKPEPKAVQPTRVMRAKGMISDKGKHAYASVHLLKMRGHIGAEAPKTIDLSPYCCPVFDQGQFGSCEGHSTAGAIYATFARRGTPLPWVPSPAGIYTLARCIDRGANKDQPLTDSGTMTASVLTGIGSFGIKAFGTPANDGRYSDCDATNVLREPTLYDLEADAVNLMIGAYSIDSIGSQKIVDVCASLAAGYAVRIDSFVDTAFEDWTPAQSPFGVPNLGDPQGGGHALYLIGYSTNADGSITFVMRNSWGSGWGRGGDILVAESFVQQADCYAWAVKRAA
jgi:hypothetical protein